MTNGPNEQDPSEGWQNGNAPVSKTGVLTDFRVRIPAPPLFPPTTYGVVRASVLSTKRLLYLGLCPEQGPIRGLNIHSWSVRPKPFTDPNRRCSRIRRVARLS